METIKGNNMETIKGNKVLTTSSDGKVRELTEEELIYYFNNKKDFLNSTLDDLKNRLNKTDNIDMIHVMSDYLSNLLFAIDKYRIEDMKQQLINQIEEKKLNKDTLVG